MDKVQRITKRRVYKLVPQEVELKDLKKGDIFVLQDSNADHHIVEEGKVINLCGDDAMHDHFNEALPYVQVEEVGGLPIPIEQLIAEGKDA